MLSGETSGDLECANVFMRTAATSNRKNLGLLDMFSFLGCDGDRDGFIYKLNLADRGESFQYRSQTALKLLGSTSRTTVSLAVASVAAIVFVLSVLGQ
jgi:hypothetical protein